MSIDLKTMLTSLIGAAIIGGFTSYVSLQNKTYLNEQKINAIQQDIQQLKQDSNSGDKKLDQILRKLSED